LRVRANDDRDGDGESLRERELGRCLNAAQVPPLWAEGASADRVAPGLIVFIFSHRQCFSLTSYAQRSPFCGEAVVPDAVMICR
jgi:hypothetical protein